MPEAQAGAVFVRLEAGVRVDDVASAAADALGVGAVGSITEETFGLDRPLRDVVRIRNLPIAFAVMLALLAVGIVAQVVVGSTHARREELGILRALGLRPGQIRGAIVVQAVAVSGSALLVGLPLGIVLGEGSLACVRAQPRNEARGEPGERLARGARCRPPRSRQPAGPDRQRPPATAARVRPAPGVTGITPADGTSRAQL